MKKILLLVVSLLVAVLTVSARHYTVIISLDGCRWDYPQFYDTPFLDQMARQGVSSGLIPSFPSKTFPNHYTLATGLYPDHHGIVANSFMDGATGEKFSLGVAEEKSNPHFYGGEPVWVTAQRQGLRTAVFYWPGSDVKVCGTYPDTYYKYDQKPRLTFQQRMDGVVRALSLPADQRPDLVMAYMEQPDASGHDFGPQSKHTRQAMMQMDSLLRRCYEGLQRLPIARDINFIVVSDHGMTWVDANRCINLKPYLKPQWVKAVEGSVPANIYAKEGCADSIYEALRHLDHVRVWHKADIPAYLHYGTNPRVGDVVVCPDLGYVVDDRYRPGGNHGYDPTMMEMHAVFRAVGPDFKHAELPHISNVDIYPLLCHLLGIHPAPCDGSLNDVLPMLK